MNAPRELPNALRPTREVQWLALAELEGSAPAGATAREPSAVPPADHPLLGVRTRVDVCVGGVALSVGELLAARPDQVLVLDRDVDDPVDLVVQGRVVARGQLVALDDRFAVRIVEPPVPLASPSATMP